MSDPTQRPPMTFEQQADLLEYLHARLDCSGDGMILSMAALDKAQADDLLATARRLRRMAPHEDEIRHLVTGR